MNSESIKNLVLKCDFLGPTPSLTIFKDNSYKSFKSAIISIIGIISIIAFSVYSIYDFFMFNNPSIIYFKDNTLTENMTINLNDLLFMFRLSENISKKLNIKLDGQVNFENGTKKTIRFEKCELGNNIDRKYEELITKFDTRSELNHTNYYCISKNDSNITIFNDKLEGERYIMISINNYCSNDLSNSYLYNGKSLSYVIQSDSINHFDRNNPLKKDYDLGDTKIFSNSDIIYTVLFLNYIEYESDNGVFFSSNKKYRGIEFYNQQDKMPRNYLNLRRNDKSPFEPYYNIINFESGIDVIGFILLRMNGHSIERYKRIYPKLQSLIADIISTIQLILLIYEFLTNNLYSNKIRVEIIKNILKDYDGGEIKINLEKKNKGDKKVELIKVDNNNKNYKGKNIILPKIKHSAITQSSDRPINENVNKGKIINKKNNNNMLLEKMNKINFCNFLLYDFSCFCKTKSNINKINEIIKINKIIEKCNELIDKEASFDNIIYKMLKIDNKKEQKIFENNEIKEIIQLLDET